MQVPDVPARAQDTHVPVQAVAQQVPCAQIPELHSEPAPHGCPLGLLPQLPPMHVLGDTQSPSALHVVRHAFAVGSQLNGSQSELVTVLQTPAPSHVRWGVHVDPVHAAGAHGMPIAHKRHPPAPLQVPSVPHVVAAVAEHCVARDGAAPLAMLLHVPALPLIAHDLHVPVQASLQQTF